MRLGTPAHLLDVLERVMSEGCSTELEVSARTRPEKKKKERVCMCDEQRMQHGAGGGCAHTPRKKEKRKGVCA